MLVFDLGGTHLRAAWFSAGKLEHVVRMNTPQGSLSEDGPRHLTLALQAAGEEVAAGRPPAAVGLAFPGPITANDRLLAPTAGMREPAGSLSHLRALMTEAWPGSEVAIINDVSAAGYHFVELGRRDFVVINVGSGIGNKIFLDGKLVVGPNGRGGEIGHWRIPSDQYARLECDCGGSGHLGAISSGRGALKVGRRVASGLVEGDAGSSLTSEDLVCAFHQGERWAVEAIERAAEPLGCVIAAVHLATGIEEFILVGGFAQILSDGYRRMVVAAAADHCWSIGQDWDRMITIGEDEAGPLLGMAYYLQHVVRGAYARS